MQALEEGAVANQYLHTTTCPEVALYYAEAFGKNSKHQIVEIELEGFNGEVFDVSDAQACNRYGIRYGSRAYNFAVKHKVVMLKGYVHPSRLGEVLRTSDLSLLSFGTGPSCADFTSMLPLFARRQLCNWRRGPPTITCRKPEVRKSQHQALCDDDSIQGRVLDEAAEKLEAKMAKLQAQRSLIKLLSEPIKERQRLEAQRQEDLKRKREEEQQIEEERQKRLKSEEADERQAELCGPRIWARCCWRDHVLQNFDRHALQVALGSNSYIILWDRAKGHRWKGIPRELANKLRGRAKELPHATLVALSPDSDCYYVQFSDGKSHYRSPPGLVTALQDDSEPPSVVALGPESSWFVAWPNGKTNHHGLPKSLRNMLSSNKDRSVAFLSISGVDCGQDVDSAVWFLRWRDEGRKPNWRLSRNAPSSLQQTAENAGNLRSIEFGSSDDWVLRYAD